MKYFNRFNDSKTCKEIYGNENYRNIEKTIKTNIDRYGVENVST